MLKAELQELKENIQDAAAFLKGLASEQRLAILCALGAGEVSVSGLQEETGLPQTTVSQHLLKLRTEGIVEFRRDHRTLYYFICDDTAKKILKILCANFTSNKRKT